MPENLQVLRNAASNQSGDNIEEAISRLKINDNKDRDATGQSTRYPDRPGEPDCSYYLRTGLCGYGNNCRYNHPAHVSLGSQYGEILPERVGKPDCEYFLKTGACKYGLACKYHHPRDRRGAAPISFNSLGLPMRKEEKPCPYYIRTGTCKFGVACKFHHPPHVSSGTSPVAGSPTSTISPSSGFAYVGGFPAWSLPRMSYFSGQGFQSYVPAFLPSSQGITPVQSWNNYMVNLLSMTSPTLPDRPDQPECRYFVNTGTCKYGSDCKFHHPKERIVQINPLGLPMRPGHAVCSYYRIYGTCKYGPACKFDHPVLAIPQNYGWTSPSFSVIDASFISYPRGLSTVQPPATSPSKLSSDKKLQHSDTKATEDPSRQADTTSNSPQDSSESLHD